MIIAFLIAYKTDVGMNDSTIYEYTQNEYKMSLNYS